MGAQGRRATRWRRAAAGRRRRAATAWSSSRSAPDPIDWGSRLNLFGGVGAHRGGFAKVTRAGRRYFVKVSHLSLQPSD